MGGDRGNYTIGELAERAGVSTSALRYYDRRGLLSPVRRSAGGYRLFDDDSLTRLRFIARAKGLGCSLDEIRDLLTLVDGDDCGPAQAHLHGLITTRIDEARRRSAELTGFATQLQAAARALDRDPIDGPCRPGCACLDPEPVTVGRPDGRTEAPAIVCTLPADDLDDRGLALEVRAPGDGAGVVDALFGTAA